MGYRYNPAIDKLMKEFSSLSPIAKSGKLEDSTGTLDISKGGTGGNTAESAKKNLGIKSAASFEANKKPGTELSEDDDSTLITVRQLYESGDKFKNVLGLGSSAYTNAFVKTDTASLRELPDLKDTLVSTGSLRGMLIKAFGELEGYGVYNTKSISSVSDIPQSDKKLSTAWALRATAEFLNNKLNNLGDSSSKNIYNGRVTASDLFDSDEKVMTTGSTKAAILKERSYFDSKMNSYTGDYNKLINKPAIRNAAYQEVTVSVSTKDPYGYDWTKTDDGAESESCVWTSKKSYRALKGLYDSLGEAAKSNNYQDLDNKLNPKDLNLSEMGGILPKGKGGTGRGDGRADFDIIDTRNLNITDGVDGGIRFNLPAGGSSKNKIVSGDDNGESIDRSSNLNVHVWWGFSIYCTQTEKYSYIHDSRTGVTRQRGDLILGSGIKSDRSLKNEGGDLYLSCGTKDELRIESGNRLSFRRSDKSVSVGWEDGKMVTGEVPVERLTGVGTAVKYNASPASFDAGSILYNHDLAFMGHVKALQDNIDWKYGPFQGVGIIDTANPSLINWGMKRVTSEGTLRAVWEKRNDGAIVDMRWVQVHNGIMNSRQEYGRFNGEVISSITIEGQVDSMGDYITISLLQVFQDGNWRTIYGTK